MILKKYFEFINENYEGFDTLGEYIESLSKDDEYARSVVSEFTKDIDTDIRIANAVNTLDKHTQEVILKLIQDNKSKTEDDEKVSVNSYTSTVFNESSESAGRNVFKCFLKVLSAVGQKSCNISWDQTPDNWLCMFVSDSVNLEQIKDVMSRYLYFDTFIKTKDSMTGISKLFFGINLDLKLEYGVNIGGDTFTLGSFPLSRGTYNYLMTLDLKSAVNLKKFLVSLDLSKLNIISKVKSVMMNYFPGQSDSKLRPSIDGDVISYAFQGLGKWDNGEIDNGEIDNLKNNLKSHLLQYKWSDKIQFNVIPSDHWVFLNIKVK